MVSKDEVTDLSILVDKKHLTAADTDPKGPKLTSPTAGYTIRLYAPPNQIHWHPAAAHWACTGWHSAIGRIQDAVADDADHSGLVFWTFTEGCQNPGNRALA